MMTPAMRLAALKAVKQGVDAAIEQATRDVEMLRSMTGAKSFDTELGSVVWTVRKPSIGFLEQPLLAWAQENMPHEVETITRVRSTLAATLRKRFEIDGDTLIDTVTGEQIDWAFITEGSEFPTVKLTEAAKDNARTAILTNLDTVTGALTVGVIGERERGREAGAA